MYKVQKHIMECQNEVKSNIFHEAFSLIHHTAFHHPHDHATVEYKDEHDDFAHRNFTLTEQEILKFFEHNHGHNVKTHDGHSDVVYDDLHAHDEHVHAHPLHVIDDHLVDENLHAHPHAQPHPHPHPHALHHVIEDNPHTIDEHPHPHHQYPHTLNEHQPPQSIVHYPHANFRDWQQQHLANSYKKTDAVQQTDKPDGEQRLLKTITAKRNPYTYFDVQTGTIAETQEQLRSRRIDLHATDIHSDHHSDHHSDIHHADLHHTDIHPTTASFKDKRIAGVSMPIFSLRHFLLNF